MQDERARLHHKEQLLWQSIAQQESIVYHLVVMLSEYMESDSVQTSALEALLNDVRAHQLKGEAGSGPANGSAPKQLYTSQMLCSAITLEQVAAIKRADVQKELVPKFRELTMRLAFLLHTSNESLLCNTLNDKVDEYSALVQLLHTAADNKLLSLGLLNFDTMQPDFPPEGHWERVCDAVHLTPQQEQTLAAGFSWYAQRRAELILDLEQHIKALQQLLQPLYAEPGADEATAAAVLGMAAGPGLTLETAEQLQDVLESIDRANRAIREVDRYCVYLSINTMERRQLGLIAVASYPYLNQPPACCAVIAARVAARSAQGGSAALKSSATAAGVTAG
ncbi:hypothetical protein OEZ86_005315 [Tetradesmus obliquus]|nr:hypothetical protein OEZ86_005315 [Tetradesmus obliquus]